MRRSSVFRAFSGSLFATIFLVACGGGGSGGAGDSAGTGTGTSGGSTTGAVGAPSVLFVADYGHNVIGAFSTLNPTPGTSLVSHIIPAGGYLGFDNGIAYNVKTDELFVVSDNTIAVFGNASTADARAVASRRISLPADIVVLGGLQLDATTDTLYVGGQRTYDSKLLVIKNASTKSGAVLPDRALIFPERFNSFSIDLRRSIMYTTGSVATAVLVYSNIGAGSGTVRADRGISVPQFSSVGAVAVDSVRDRLYVTWSGVAGSGIALVTGASTTSPTVLGTIAVPGPRIVAVDAANDRIYAGAHGQAYLINQASKVSPSSTPVEAIAALAPAGSLIGGFAFP